MLILQFREELFWLQGHPQLIVGFQWQLLYPPFTLNCTAYTTAYVTSNGQLTLGGSAPSAFTYTGISSTIGSGIAICPFSADLNEVNNNASTEVRWQTVGTETIFQWTQFCRYGVTQNFDFQVRLTCPQVLLNLVIVRIQALERETSYQPEVGIRTSSTDYNNRKVGTGAETWATSLVGTANTDICRFTSTAVAQSFVTNQMYTWTPPAACSGAPANGTTTVSAGSVCSGTTVNLAVTGSLSGGCGVTFQWQSSPDNSAWSNIAGATASTNTNNNKCIVFYNYIL